MLPNALNFSRQTLCKIIISFAVDAVADEWHLWKWHSVFQLSPRGLSNVRSSWTCRSMVSTQRQCDRHQSDNIVFSTAQHNDLGSVSFRFVSWHQFEWGKCVVYCVCAQLKFCCVNHFSEEWNFVLLDSVRFRSHLNIHTETLLNRNCPANGIEWKHHQVKSEREHIFAWIIGDYVPVRNDIVLKTPTLCWCEQMSPNGEQRRRTTSIRYVVSIFCFSDFLSVVCACVSIQVNWQGSDSCRLVPQVDSTEIVYQISMVDWSHSDIHFCVQCASSASIALF